MKEVTFADQTLNTINVNDLNREKDHAIALKNNKAYLILNNRDEKTGVFYRSNILNLRTLKYENEIEKQIKIKDNLDRNSVLEIFNSFGYKIYTAKNTISLFQKMLDHLMEVSEIL